ncbi:MAG: hypothetical protein P8H87_02505 [Flavobacteriaceae bacterium]|nr:hypothetical protein [Flavobacteriaceae bacterium]
MNVAEECFLYLKATHHPLATQTRCPAATGSTPITDLTLPFLSPLIKNKKTTRKGWLWVELTWGSLNFIDLNSFLFSYHRI